MRLLQQARARTAPCAGRDPAARRRPSTLGTKTGTHIGSNLTQTFYRGPEQVSIQGAAIASFAGRSETTPGSQMRYVVNLHRRAARRARYYSSSFTARCL